MGCHNRRIHSHKVFKKSSMGWFYGFKLHAVFNHLGELVNFFLSAGNMDDRKGLKQMADKLFGTLIGDRGYIGKKLGQWLKEQYGITLLTKNKKGMKAQSYSAEQKYLLTKMRGQPENAYRAKPRLHHHRHCCLSV